MFLLHDDLITLCVSYVWDLTSFELKDDLDFYIQWQRYVPHMFLQTAVLDTRFWYTVANPMCKYNPYYPRKYLSLRPADIWSPSLRSLGSMICKEKIRSLKTYKGCVLRWIDDCTSNRHLFYWFYLARRVLSRLKITHFQTRAPCFFVREALEEICSCTASLVYEAI